MRDAINLAYLVKGAKLLPPADQINPAQAFHINAADIPVYDSPAGSRVRVVAGTAHGLTSPLQVSTRIRFLDVIIPAHGAIEHDIAAGEPLFIFAVKGAGEVGDRAIQAQSAALFDRQGNRVQVRAGKDGLQYVLGGNEPLT